MVINKETKIFINGGIDDFKKIIFFKHKMAYTRAVYTHSDNLSTQEKLPTHIRLCFLFSLLFNRETKVGWGVTWECIWEELGEKDEYEHKFLCKLPREYIKYFKQ